MKPTTPRRRRYRHCCLFVFRRQHVCGGPDDYSFNPFSTTETASVATGAIIQLLPQPGNPSDIETIPVAQSPAYLQSDQGTKLFVR